MAIGHAYDGGGGAATERDGAANNAAVKNAANPRRIDGSGSYGFEMVMFGIVTDDDFGADPWDFLPATTGVIGPTGTRIGGSASVDCPVALGLEPMTVTRQFTRAPAKSSGAVNKPFGCLVSDCGLTVTLKVTEAPGVVEAAYGVCGVLPEPMTLPLSVTLHEAERKFCP